MVSAGGIQTFLPELSDVKWFQNLDHETLRKSLSEKEMGADMDNCIEKRINEKQIMRAESGDITSYGSCIVNAANESLLGGSGVDGAIHRAAGPKLLEECRTLGGCPTGEAKITKGYNLKAEYVIHTPGPVYSFHEHPELLLAGCYRNSLELARKYDIHEISFPAISTGVYGYPKGEAAEIAIGTVREWLDANPDYEILVRFVCFGSYDYEFYRNVFRK